jgi:hypothetical protein
MTRPLFLPAFGLMLALLASSAACHQPVDPLASDTRASVTASIAFLNLEGGCWTIEMSPTVHYLPMNLPDEFRTLARPPQIMRFPRSVPLSRASGATPASAAICLWVSVPSSGNSPSSV